MLTESQLIQGLDEITPIPGALLRLTEMVTMSDYSIKDVLEVVNLDPGMTADVLRMANSVQAMGLEQIVSVQQAVTRMGAPRIAEYLLSKWLQGKVNIDPRLYGVTSTELWRHSIIVANSGVILVQKTKPDLVNLVYSAGLLHDIGKTVLSYFGHRLGIETLDMESELPNEQYLEQAELDVFGICHSEAGALLLERWKLPQSIVDIVRHHESSTEQLNLPTDCIRMGNATYNGLRMSEGERKAAYPAQIGERLSVSASEFVHHCFEVRQATEDTLALYS
jgi:putative nucleotidyltransferase with HDIG domain